MKQLKYPTPWLNLESKGVPPMPLHHQGPKPYTLNETESIAHVYSNTKKSCHQSWRIIIKVKWFIITKSRSLASKFPQSISFVSAPERDVTYTPSWSKLCPEVSQYKCRNNVPQYHKYHNIINLSIKQKWKLLAHIICVLPGRRVRTIIVPLDLDLIYRSTS